MRFDVHFGPFISELFCLLTHKVLKEANMHETQNLLLVVLASIAGVFQKF